MRKQLGHTNQKARAAAVTALGNMKGKNINNLKDSEVKDLLLIVLQLLGLADADGNIK